MYAIDPRTRLPKIIRRVPGGGSVPSSFSFERTGRWLLVANQGSNTINVFKVDHRTGGLTGTDSALAAEAVDRITFSA